jgi:hypothetical protein
MTISRNYRQHNEKARHNCLPYREREVSLGPDVYIARRTLEHCLQAIKQVIVFVPHSGASRCTIAIRTPSRKCLQCGPCNEFNIQLKSGIYLGSSQSSFSVLPRYASPNETIPRPLERQGIVMSRGPTNVMRSALASHLDRGAFARPARCNTKAFRKPGTGQF